jgi:hypothetical protein
MSITLESTVQNAQARAGEAMVIAQVAIQSIKDAAAAAATGSIMTNNSRQAAEAKRLADEEARTIHVPALEDSVLYNALMDGLGTEPGDIVKAAGTDLSEFTEGAKDRSIFDLGFLGGASGDSVLDAADQLVNITTTLQTAAEEIGQKFSLENLTSYLFSPLTDPAEPEQYVSPVYGVLDIATSLPKITAPEDMEVPKAIKPEGWPTYEAASLDEAPEVRTYESPLYSMDFGGVPVNRTLDTDFYNAFFDAYNTVTGALHIPTITFVPPDLTEFKYSDIGQAELDAQLAAVGSVFKLLQSVLESGENSGLSTLVPEDQAILTYEEGRDREAGIYKDSMAGIHRDFAARGFRLPQPASAALLSKASVTYAKALSGVNRAVIIERMKLHTDVCKFAIQNQIETSKVILDYVDKMANRALLAAEKAANFQIASYNLKAELYKLEVENVISESKLAADVLAGNLRRLEIYKESFTELEFNNKYTQLSLEATKTANMTQSMLVEKYKAELEAAKTKLAYSHALLDVEKMAVQKFSAIAEARARIIESDISVEDLKIKAYSVASSTELQAAQIENQKAETAISKSRLELDAIKATYERALLQVDVVRAQTDAGVADANRLIGLLNALSSRYEALLHPVVSAAGALASLEINNNNMEVQRAQLEVDKDKTNRTFEMEGRKLSVEAAAAGVPIAAAMVTAALHGIGINASQASW